MDKKVILITGSSRGLGAHAAYRFAQTGFTVIINSSKSSEQASQLVDKIHNEIPDASVHFYQADVGNRNEVRSMFESIYSKLGRCDVLINMAGVNKDGPFLEMNDENWDTVLRTILTWSSPIPHSLKKIISSGDLFISSGLKRTHEFSLNVRNLQV